MIFNAIPVTGERGILTCLIILTVVNSIMESSCFGNPLHLSKLGSTIAAQAAWNAVYQQKRLIYNSITFDTNSMHNLRII